MSRNSNNMLEFHKLVVIMLAVLLIGVEIVIDFAQIPQIMQMTFWQWGWGIIVGCQMFVTKWLRIPIAPGKWYDFTYVPIWMLVFTLPGLVSFLFLIIFTVLIYFIYPHQFYCRKTVGTYFFHMSYQIILFFVTIQGFELVLHYLSISIRGLALTGTVAMFASMFALMFTDTLLGGLIQKFEGQPKVWHEWHKDYMRITIIQTILSSIAMLMAVLYLTGHYFQLTAAYAFFMLGVSVMYKSSFRQDHFLGLMRSMVSMVEIKDTYTKNHSESVGHYSTVLGQILGLPAAQLESLKMVALLHDVGKIGIPDDILKKEDSLTSEEYEIMKTHAQLGEKVLLPILSLQREAFIIGRHHEHINGSGYPHGLVGNEIPLEARIVTIADSYHAMISHRPYRRGLGVNEAVRRLQESKGKQFDAELVDLFCDYALAPAKHAHRFRPFCLVH